MFQSEKRLSKELSRILTSPIEKIQSIERRALEDEEDFVVYLPSDTLEFLHTPSNALRIRDGAELVFET